MEILLKADGEYAALDEVYGKLAALLGIWPKINPHR
jgi:hypothetical protein